MDPFSLTAVAIAVAFLFGFVARQVGLPPLVGFLVAGFVLNALGMEPPEAIETLGELGVTLLLFLIGLKLKIKSLLRPEVWGGASLHAVITVCGLTAVIWTLAVVGLPVFASLSFTGAVLIAFALSFSSTVFSVKVLEDKGEMSTLHGRTAIGILIMQDIFAVVFLTASTGELPSLWALALLGLFAARPLLVYLLDRCGHGELLPLFGLFSALVLGAAAFKAVGMKPDLGALILGMMLANHNKASEIAHALLNVKDVLLVGFFLYIGLAGLPGLEIGLVALALVLLIPLKVALFFFLLTRFSLRGRTSMLASLNLATYSEFGLIVEAIAVDQGWVDAQWLVVIAIALSVSLIAAAPVNRASQRIWARFSGTLERLETARRHPEEQPIQPSDATIAIIGMGRIGTGAYEYFRSRYGDTVVGIEVNPAKVEAHRQAERRIIMGDATDPGFWERGRAGQRDGRRSQVRLVMLAMPEHKANMYALEQLEAAGYAGYVAAVANYPDQAQRLLKAGADSVFNTYAEAGAGFASDVEARMQQQGLLISLVA